MLALLILIQVTAVPGWNQQLEYEHNLRVQEDMRDLDRALEQAATTGTPASTVVELGVRYPTRPFLFNPGPASGTIETGPEGEVQISNADVVGAENAWDGGAAQTYATREIVYRPGYNEYENAPRTAYENGVLYNDYDGTVLAVTEPDVVDGRQVNLVTTTGQLSESSAAPTTLHANPRSDRTQTVAVRSADGSPIEIRLPTQLNESQWRGLLEPELDETGSQPGAYIQTLTVETGSPYNTLVLELDPGSATNPQTYDFRMANVALESDVGRERAHYVTGVDDEDRSLRPGETRQLEVEVRNRYNNPVSGVPVTFERTSGSGEFVVDGQTTTGAIQRTTGSDGRATVRYRSFTNSEVTVSGDLDGSGAMDVPREQTTLVIDTSGDSTGTGADNGGINPYGDRSVVLTGSDVNNAGCGGGGQGGAQCNVDIVLQNRDTTTARTITDTRINFVFTGSAAQNPPQSARMFSQLLQVRGPFVEFTTATSSRTIGADSSKTVSIRFYDTTSGSSPSNMGGVSHLIAITMIYDNGQTATYFVDTSD